MIITMLLVCFLGGFFLYDSNRRNNFISEAIKFKEIYPIVARWPDSPHTYFENKFVIIQSAVENFRQSVSPYKRWFFDRAWRIYRVGHDKSWRNAKQEYTQYSGATFSDEPYIEPKQRFKEDIDRLLSFTK